MLAVLYGCPAAAFPRLPHAAGCCRAARGRQRPGELNKAGLPVSQRGVRFEDFVLQFDTSSRGGFRAKVLKSPFGEGGVGFSLPPLTAMAALDVSGISRDIGHQEAATTGAGRPPLEVGTELYRSVFQGQVRSLLDKSRGQLELSSSLGLRLKIKIDPSDEEAGALAELPWELLCDGEMEDFFALSRQMSLVRYLDVPRSSQPIPFTPPLRILAVGASPSTMAPLDLKQEEQRLEELNHSGSGIEVRFLSNASAGAVREALAGDTYSVLHFMGHGAFDRASGEGMLAFEGAYGLPDLVSGKAFATKLKDLRSLGVVMLNACNTARAGQGGANPFRGVATALVLGGVPAVVAMQRPITDRAAIGFSTAFYRHLARGDSIDEALTEGRQAIHSAQPEGFEWATPVLFLRIPDGNVFVAKPAERLEEVPPAPAPASLAVPSSAPASPKRGTAIKIGTGAVGTGLLAFVLYTKVINPASEPARPAGHESTETHNVLTSDSVPETSTGKLQGRNPEPQKSGKPVSESKNKGKGPMSQPEGSTTQKITLSSPGPSPVAPQTSEAAEAAPSHADLSALSTEVVSIAPQDAGLRATVSFKNNGSHRLTVVLDAENSFLTDDQGRGHYDVIESSLPQSGSNPKLALAPGEASRSTFDFQAPQLGSNTRFRLKLVTKEGLFLKISNLP
jgi:CHAT domain